jgi:hypothetical protein
LVLQPIQSLTNEDRLLPELKRIEYFKVFKNKLKIYLLQNCFYSLQEFFLVSVMDGSLVAQVSFDAVWMYIDGISVCVALY